MSYPGYDSMDERRKQLLQSLGTGGSNGGRLMGGPRRAMPLYGGLGRGHGGDFAAAPLPQLSFNPFLAQAKMGIPGLSGPSNASDFAPPASAIQGAPISDATGAPAIQGASAPQAVATQGQAGRMEFYRAPNGNTPAQVDPAALQGAQGYPGVSNATNPYLLHFLRYQASFGGE